MKLPTMPEKNAWRQCPGVLNDSDVPEMKALQSIQSWRAATWWRSRSAWDMRVNLTNASRWKTHVELS